MLRVVCARMGSISSLPFPSLAQHQAAKDSVGGHGEEQISSSTRAAPLPSPRPQVRNASSDSEVQEIWIIMAALPLANSVNLVH